MTDNTDNQLWTVLWTFTVTWDPGSGPLPDPILQLFQHRSIVEPGRARHQAGEGHVAYYVRAVQEYVTRYHPGRTDIVASAAKRKE